MSEMRCSSCEEAGKTQNKMLFPKYIQKIPALVRNKMVLLHFDLCTSAGASDLMGN